MFQLRWNAGVQQLHDLCHGRHPGRRLQSTRLSNIGIGHGAIDAGGGYTYFNPQTGHELSGVLGFTYNFINTSTQYQNGVDLHFDWGASQFLSKELMVGLVGYIYKEIGCDSGSGDHVGCFQSQVVRHRSPDRVPFPGRRHAGLSQSEGLWRVRCGKPAIRLEYLGDLLHFAARARSASDDKADRQKILEPGRRPTGS